MNLKDLFIRVLELEWNEFSLVVFGSIMTFLIMSTQVAQMALLNTLKSVMMEILLMVTGVHIFVNLNTQNSAWQMELSWLHVKASTDNIAEMVRLTIKIFAMMEINEITMDVQLFALWK